MFEGLGGRAAAGACYIGVVVPPGGVCSQVALACSHLVYSSSHELVESDEGVGGKTGCVGVLVGGGVL